MTDKPRKGQYFKPATLQQTEDIIVWFKEEWGMRTLLSNRRIAEEYIIRYNNKWRGEPPSKLFVEFLHNLFSKNN
jgi:hypothetical protein